MFVWSNAHCAPLHCVPHTHKNTRTFVLVCFIFDRVDDHQLYSAGVCVCA